MQCTKETNTECECHEGFVPLEDDSSTCKCNAGFEKTRGGTSMNHTTIQDKVKESVTVVINY